MAVNTLFRNLQKPTGFVQVPAIHRRGADHHTSKSMVVNYFLAVGAKLFFVPPPRWQLAVGVPDTTDAFPSLSSRSGG